MPKTTKPDQETSGKLKHSKLTDLCLHGKEHEANANTAQMATANGKNLKVER